MKDESSHAGVATLVIRLFHHAAHLLYATGHGQKPVFAMFIVGPMQPQSARHSTGSLTNLDKKRTSTVPMKICAS